MPSWQFRQDSGLGAPLGALAQEFEIPSGHPLRELDQPTDILTFDGAVGSDHENKPSDVAKLEVLLGGLGYFDVDKTDGPTGQISIRLDDAIKGFQADNQLQQDGVVKPHGPTLIRISDWVQLGPDGKEQKRYKWNPQKRRYEPALPKSFYGGDAEFDAAAGRFVKRRRPLDPATEERKIEAWTHEPWWHRLFRYITALGRPDRRGDTERPFNSSIRG